MPLAFTVIKTQTSDLRGPFIKWEFERKIRSVRAFAYEHYLFQLFVEIIVIVLSILCDFQGKMIDAKFELQL